jgi:hypothetical protein
MSFTTLPAPARSGQRATAPAAPGAPFRAHGALLSAGALAWAASIAAVGVSPAYGSPAGMVFAVGSGLFQLGLFALLRVMARTRALGTGRFARGYLVGVAVVLALALLSTVLDGIGVTDLTNPVFLVVDLCWPLSMLGMFTLAVRIAVAGRWSGLTRWWPLVAESWALVTIPVTGALGPQAGQVVGALHLVVGYAVLGVLVARKRA